MLSLQVDTSPVGISSLLKNTVEHRAAPMVSDKGPDGGYSIALQPRRKRAHSPTRHMAGSQDCGSIPQLGIELMVGRNFLKRCWITLKCALELRHILVHRFPEVGICKTSTEARNISPTWRIRELRLSY